MKTKINFIVVFALVFALILLSSCKRKGVEEPSPFAPSSFAVVLKMNASPNVLFAGTNHKASTITASLKKYDGVPQANKTVHFEITDGLGNKLNIGYFEGNQSVKSKDTDSSGNATVTYYGPLAEDLTADTTIYIQAKVAWDGKQIISSIARLDIVRDVTNLKIRVSADPNSVYAGTTRDQSTITATLMTAAGTALSNESILFEIVDESGETTNLGGFEGNELFKTVATDENGIATVDYYGPLATELSAKSITENTTIYIRASADWDAETAFYAETPVHIILSYIEQVLDVSANPNALFAGTHRETSTITATLKTIDGTPVANKTVHFEITDDAGDKLDLGYFDNMESVKSVSTDAIGTATVTYFGPIDQEITENTTVYIKAHTLSDDDTSLSATAPITIIRDVTSIILDVSAYPDVMYAGTERDESDIYATLKTAVGTPLTNRTLYFEITNSSGTQVNIGYFEGNEIVKAVKTDDNGMAIVKYYGPLRDEISSSTTVSIKVYASSEGEESITSGTVDITIIREGTDIELNISANPNVITAGETRETSTVSAVIKTADGSSLDNQSILFEICSDSAGTTQVDTGYFEGNQSIIARTTDENGVATVDYYGPLASEITQSTTVYIKATLSWQGSTLISSVTAPIQIIRKSETPTITVSVDPNAITAGSGQAPVYVTATVKLPGNDPVVGENIIFEITNASGTPVSIGNFEGNVQVIVKTTNASGEAKVTYYGPLASQITGNQTVYIKATLFWEGSTTIYKISGPITIVDESNP
jgi:hypothetical protein